MACTDGDAVQSQADRRAASIEFCIVYLGGDDIFDVLAGNGAHYEVAHQKTRDGRIAVGKMQSEGAAGVFVSRRRETHALNRTLRQAHALESGHPETPAVEGGHRVGAHAPFTHGARVIETEYRGVHSYDIA